MLRHHSPARCLRLGSGLSAMQSQVALGKNKSQLPFSWPVWSCPNSPFLIAASPDLTMPAPSPKRPISPPENGVLLQPGLGRSPPETWVPGWPENSNALDLLQVGRHYHAGPFVRCPKGRDRRKGQAQGAYGAAMPS